MGFVSEVIGKGPVDYYWHALLFDSGLGVPQDQPVWHFLVVFPVLQHQRNPLFTLFHLVRDTFESHAFDVGKTSLRLAASRPHIWWGVSVENKKFGLPRVAHLRSSPAAVRFLSIEPLLEDLGTVNLTGINWVIVGGESGIGARPIERKWVVSIRRQCRLHGISFFFKQWGGVHKSKAGRILDGRTYDEMPTLDDTRKLVQIAAR